MCNPRAPRSASVRLRWQVAGVVMAALMGTSTARAQGGPVSADPEFVNPRFGGGAIPGVYVPDADERNTVRFGMFMQYERNPVTGYRLDEEVGLIVANRFQAHLGVSWDFADWGTARVVVPAAANWGTQFPEFAAEGFGLGDIVLGAQFLPYRSKVFNFGLYADLGFPSGRSEAYIGEPSFRIEGGAELMGKVGFGQLVSLDIVGGVAVVGRPVSVTNQDFDLGPDLKLSQALRLRFAWLPQELAITQALVARSGFTNFFGGGAESGVELYGGVQLPFRNVFNFTDLTLDVMIGRGATEGYGTTDLRALAGLTFTRHPGRVERNEIVEIKRPPPRIPDPPTVEPPEDPPEVQETETEILIRDPVEFFVDTADIRPESLPLLQKVADVINADARIKHLVVEGHASEEGDHTYNYELSKKRAESVYKQLIVNGVAPERLSYRGKGEVEPKVAGSTEDAWKFNRRVEFHIVARFPESTVTFPTYPGRAKLPWQEREVDSITPLTPDEQEQDRLRQFYEEQQERKKAESFVDPTAEPEALRFEGEPAPEPEPEPEAPAEDASEPAEATSEGEPAAAPAEEGASEEAPPAEREADAFDGLDFSDPDPAEAPAAPPAEAPPAAEPAPADAAGTESDPAEDEAADPADGETEEAQ